jgi:uncharacterized protein (TIGR02001 family)
MFKSLLPLSFAALVISAAPTLALSQTAAPAKAPEPDYTLTANISLVTDYRYRGISQTRLKPAIQGTVDFAHSSGFYLGAFATNIRWIRDLGGEANVEIDLYGGYKGSISGDLGYDVGVLQYFYPSNRLTPSANTTEIYAGLTYKQYGLKYYNALTNQFGFVNSKRSGYLDATANFDLGNGWGVNGHIGHQSIRNGSAASYTDFKLGGTKEIGGLVLGAAIVATDADRAGYTAKTKYLGGTGVVFSLGKNF